MANLLARIAFDKSVSRRKANLAIRMASELSFSSLCIMYLVSKNRYSVSEFSKLAADNVARNPDYSGEIITYVAEMSNMTSMGILNGDFMAMLGITTWARDKQNNTLLLLGVGPVLYRLMDLEKISSFKEDIDKIEQVLGPALQEVTDPG
jgi:hypothetical protein